MPFTLVPLAEADPQAVEQLLDAAFGADRRTRTAYRLREGETPIAAFSLAARDGAALVGALVCWPIALHDGEQATPLVLVGPVAVAPDRQNEGIGRAMMHAMLERGGAGEPLVLIGDPEYYGRWFGFIADQTTNWELPGPFERRRLLARANGRDLPFRGTLGPRHGALERA